MNRIQRRSLWALLTMGVVGAGCRGVQDRQMIYTEPRMAPVHVDTRDGVRVRAPFVDVHVPKSRPLPASNGVDVPIVEPE